MDSSSPLPPAGALPVGGHLVRTLRLAFPVMLARAGLIIMVTVGTVMAGRAGGSACTGSEPATPPANANRSHQRRIKSSSAVPT